MIANTSRVPRAAPTPTPIAVAFTPPLDWRAMGIVRGAVGVADGAVVAVAVDVDEEVDALLTVLPVILT
jgi:hypothetical protein